MKAAPSASDAGLDALAAACRGAVSIRKLDDSTRVFAGTAASLYENSGTAWTEVSATTAGYSLGSDNRWRWAQFGNVSLATAKTEKIQSSTSGAFAAIASAPKAAIIETVNNFVIAFDTNETSYGDSPDRWWCCAKGDQTDWTPAVATECVTGRLTSAPGPIKAAKRFGDQIVAYKERSMFIGSYVGQPNAFNFVQVPGEVGALSNEVVVSIGTPDDPMHIFMGVDDFYKFDGSRPLPIGKNRVKENVFGSINRTYSGACISLHDRTKGLVYFFYATTASMLPDKCVVYNYRTDKWGRDDRQIEAALEYVVASLTYQGFGTSYATYGAAPNVPYGSSIFVAGYPQAAIINTSHKVATLSGVAAVSSYTTGDIGDDNVESLLSFVKPRYITAPASASQTNYYKQNAGDAVTTDATIALSSGRFDVLREARWHRVLHSMNGDWEAPGAWWEVERAGVE